MNNEDNIKKRNRLQHLRAQLEMDRSSYISHWRDLADNILPRRARFTLSNDKRGDKVNQNIIDNTGTLANRTLQSGMMAGVTSPARPWFKLTSEDPMLADSENVKAWMHIVSSRMATVFIRSNLYNALPVLYGSLGTFGTGSMLMEEAFDGSVVRFYPFPIGSYYLANDSKLRVDTFIREFRLTVRQIVDQFGKQPDGSIKWDNITETVKNQYENNNLETTVDVVHTIYPNPDYKENRLEAKYKKWASVYYEAGQSARGQVGSSTTDNAEGKFLRESGFDFFPVLAPRWESTAEDVYGNNCPGMVALGDVKQLQMGEKRALQAIDKQVNPPMIGPESLRNKKASLLPGDITYNDVREGTQGFRPVHEVRFDVNSMEMKQQQVRQRIQRAYFEDLFLMLAQSDRRQITAREIDERHEEKLLALGPVLEQLNQDLLDPLIDNTFALMLRQGLIPDPPEELQGRALKVEYVSVMAQAQKLAGLGNIDRFTGYIGNVAGVDPGILDVVNTDELAYEYGDLTSMRPGVVRAKEEVQEIREARAKAQQQQAQAEQASMQADTAKKLSDAEPSDESLLRELGL